jgi:hypothetical protein
MSLIVKRSFYEGDTLHTEGSVFEHSDKEYIEKCIADENVVDADNEDVSAQVAQVQTAADIQAEDTARHEALQSQSAPVAAQPSQLAPPQTPAGPQLTPEQVARDFQNAGAAPSSNAPQLQ